LPFINLTLSFIIENLGLRFEESPKSFWCRFLQKAAVQHDLKAVFFGRLPSRRSRLKRQAPPALATGSDASPRAKQQSTDITQTSAGTR
jgi:hypothetical protein